MCRLRQPELRPQDLVEQGPRNKTPGECDLPRGLAGWVAQARSFIARCPHDGFGYAFNGVRHGHRTLIRHEIFRAAGVVGGEWRISRDSARFKRSARGSRLDDNDAYAEFTHLMVERFRISLDRVFTCRIVGAVRSRNKPEPGTDIENAPATLPSHDRRHSIGHPHDAVKISLEQQTDLRDRTFFRRAGYSDPGIIHQQIDLPEFGMRPSYGDCNRFI